MPKGNVKMSSKWEWELWRDGKMIDSWVDHNICTTAGLNSLMDVYFNADTQITTWYVAPFESDYTPVAGATYAVPGYTESTAYTEANRQAWSGASAAAGSVTNSASKAVLSINATKTIYGAALVGGGTGAATKGDTAGGGTLYNVSRFSSGSKAVESGDTMKITVTITASDV